MMELGAAGAAALTADQPIRGHSERSAQDRAYEVEPQVGECAHQHRGSQAACRVQAGARDGCFHHHQQCDQGSSQPRRETRKAAAVHAPEDEEHQRESHHEFGRERDGRRVARARSRHAEIHGVRRFARHRHDHQDAENGAACLREAVGERICSADLAAQPEREGHRRIEVPTAALAERRQHDRRAPSCEQQPGRQSPPRRRGDELGHHATVRPHEHDGADADAHHDGCTEELAEIVRPPELHIAPCQIDRITRGATRGSLEKN